MKQRNGNLGGLYGAEDAARRTYGNENLTFIKTGDEIRKAITGRIAVQKGEIEKLQSEINDICKRRDIDVKEVIDSAVDHTRIEAYETKAMSNVAQTNALMNALQLDLNRLRVNSSMIISVRNDIDFLDRVARNIAPEGKFELFYNDLVSFGF